MLVLVAALAVAAATMSSQADCQNMMAILPKLWQKLFLQAQPPTPQMLWHVQTFRLGPAGEALRYKSAEQQRLRDSMQAVFEQASGEQHVPSNEVFESRAG